MINVPTVFIVGAGASTPYGFPIGTDLVTLICNNLMDSNSEHVKQLCEIGNCLSSDILRFRNELFYSRKMSVDAFLEHREDWLEIGKYSIAQSLIGFENSESLFSISKGDWYRYIYDKLNTSFDDFDKNKLGIITFNYDRSIEHYLFTALKNTYGKSDEDCAAKIKNIPIIHVHGKLGELPWQNKSGRKYQNHSPDFIKDISIAASGIRIIHDYINVNEDELFIQAHSLLEEARKIYFLGFGYNETNMKRLSFPSGKIVGGSAYKLQMAEMESIEKIFNSYGYARSLAADKLVDMFLGSSDRDTLGFIRSHIIFE